MKTYVVCLDSHFIRDAQVMNTIALTDEEFERMDICNMDENWNDITPNAFVDIVQAENEENACKLAAQKKKYDSRCLYAIDTSNGIHIHEPNKSNKDKVKAAIFSEEGKQAYLDIGAILQDISKKYDCKTSDVFYILGTALSNCATEIGNLNEVDKVELLKRQFRQSAETSYQCFEKLRELGIDEF